MIVRLWMPSSPVGDRNLWAQEGGQEWYNDHYCYPPHLLFQTYSPPLFYLYAPFSKDFSPLTHISPLSSIFRPSSHRLPYSFSVLLCFLFRCVCLYTHSLPSTTYIAPIIGAMYFWVKNSNMNGLGVVWRWFYMLLEDFYPQRDHITPCQWFSVFAWRNCLERLM